MRKRLTATAWALALTIAAAPAASGGLFVAAFELDGFSAPAISSWPM